MVLDRSRAGRRMQIARLRAAGATERQVATALGIGIRVVREHFRDMQVIEQRIAEQRQHSWPYVLRAKYASAELRARDTARKYGHDPRHPDRLPVGVTSRAAPTRTS